MERKPETEAQYLQIAAGIDEETCFWSGNFSSSLGFQTMLNEGEAVLPLLLEQITDPEATGFWWRAEMICTIATKEDKKIAFAEEDLGRLEKVKATILNWGLVREYIKLG